MLLVGPDTKGVQLFRVFLKNLAELSSIIIITVSFAVTAFVPKHKEVIDREQQIENRQHRNTPIAPACDSAEKPQRLVDMAIECGVDVLIYRQIVELLIESSRHDEGIFPPLLHGYIPQSIQERRTVCVHIRFRLLGPRELEPEFNGPGKPRERPHAARCAR